MNGVSNGKNGKDDRENIVDFSSFLATKERIFQSNKQVNRVANMKTDGQELKEHVYVVVRLTEIFISGQNVDVKSQCVKYVFDVEKRFILVHVVSHENYVEISCCLQKRYISYQNSWMLSAFFLQVKKVRNRK